MTDLATFHSAVWQWLATAKPGTYKVDAIVPYINQQVGRSGQDITIADRSLFIEGVMFWIDSGMHPQCDFNAEYVKMRIYPNPNDKLLTMKKLLYASVLACLLVSCSPKLYLDETGLYRKVGRNDYLKSLSLDNTKVDSSQHYHLEKSSKRNQFAFR